MPAKAEILHFLQDGPKSEKQLKAALGTDKKYGKAMKALLQSHRIEKKKGLYSAVAAGSVTTVLPSKGKKKGPLAKLVKLGRNFGFAAAADGSGDIFIPGHALLGAMPGDEVWVTLSEHPRVAGSREGEVYSFQAYHNRVVGLVEEENGNLYLRPSNAQYTLLAIKKSADGGVKPGETAAGQILERGGSHRDHVVGITLRYGSAESARQCAKAILFAAGIEKNFPLSVKNTAKMAAEAPLEKEFIKRLDLRGETVFTIDAASTKDIDDAISIERTDTGYHLGVHIADVSHYVRPHTALDEEALKRGTSVYYADSVVPMLPKVLSNGVCSLHPGEDKLAFSCLMEVGKNGKVKDFRFAKTLIQSRVKGVYEEINQLWKGEVPETLRQKYAPVEQALQAARELYEKLKALRALRGSLELETDEPKLVLDKEGRCVDVQPRCRGEAERMIEELMLLANGCAAQTMKNKDIPFVYRVHEKPALDRIENLRRILDALGVRFETAHDIPTQQEYAVLLNGVRNTPLARPVSEAVLRSMAKARYDAKPYGHYGLALEDYTHFTSPIRRYPDLAIHRILSDYAAGEKPGELRKRYGGFVQTVAQRTSETELAAQRVERDCDDCYKAEFMKQHVGQVFEGVITSVLPFGFYVQLPNTIEGLIHISRLAQQHLELVDGVALENTKAKISYRIGNPIRVKVIDANVLQGNVDFDLA